MLHPEKHAAAQRRTELSGEGAGPSSGVSRRWGGASLAPSGQNQGRLRLRSVRVTLGPALSACGHLTGAWTGAVAVTSAGKGKAQTAARAVALLAIRGSPFPRERSRRHPRAPCFLGDREMRVLSVSISEPRAGVSWETSQKGQMGGHLGAASPAVMGTAVRSGNVPEPALL